MSNSDVNTNNDREIRYELMRPNQLIAEQKQCPLIFVPVAPLEYHGPHMPLGTDPINATETALEACSRLGKGVVLPTVYWGTERERPSWMNESLGFKKDDWIYGMDFPTALWKSHYYQEHIFGLVVSQKIEMLIDHGYKVIVIVNGHGAWNHMETIDRLCKYYSQYTDTRVTHHLAFPLEVSEFNLAGHADLYETSLIMYYHERGLGKHALVDLGELPSKDVPIRYPEFSIVDGNGFSKNPSPDKIVQTDPREATAEKGKETFEQTVEMFLKLTNNALKEKGLA
jgi:creatinine amidohydrolase